ncbi:MAG: ImmA/IrrE family metallo-endopeptidase, partial [Actinobacteria bacterium]|nr:ImmA/IrrE family metallo-endopeptidase [Actinomycetota bacterium]
VEQLREVLNFFGVANRGAFKALWNEAVAFRQSVAYEADPGSVAAWLRVGELEAGAISCQPFDRRRFAQALREARKLTVIRDAGVFLPKLQGLCAAAGVAVVVVEETPRARVFGAARWLTPEKGLIQLSFRYKSNDVFWFTFFHEGRHILQETKRQTILEGKDTKLDDAERDADQFAADLLIPPAYRRRLHDIDTLADARALAEELEVAPGIVVGRLHFLELKPYSWGANLKWRYEFSD